ncbi:MAG: YigZ family protein [Oscillospiraceae bacterium]|nr:YigZ family protein [Oscillospiraceae bacterium]
MHEIVVKKSRFIGYAALIESENDAKAFIAQVTGEHSKARHICYAYVLPGTAKSNDAGEPKGTAGLPIYNVITRRKLENIIVVVVRYFGGTLLGRGGLIRAYSKAARLAIDGIV